MPPTLGPTRVRRTVTLLTAIALSTLTLVTVVPGTISRADDNSAGVTAPAGPRRVTVNASTNYETDRARPARARTQVATAKVNKSSRAVYYTFPAVTPGSSEALTSATLVLKVKSAAKARKGTLLVQPVTGEWTDSVVSYRTRPRVGAVVGRARITRGTVTIPLRTSAVAGHVAAGLTVRIVRSSSKAIVKLAGTPSLRTTLSRTVAAATTTTPTTNAPKAPAATTNAPTAPVASSTPSVPAASSPAPTAAASAPATTPTPDAEQPLSAAAGEIEGKPVFAHYFPPYPISLDNEPGASDYYAENYLVASGEGGKFASTGGLLRDRPLPRDPISTGDFQLADMRTEVAQAQKAGLDGFAVDILTTSNTDRNWTLIEKLMTAAAEKDFQIMLQPDMSALASISTGTFAQAMATLSRHDAVYRATSGAVVVSPFYAEIKTASWYADALALMKSKYGVDAVLLPLFLDAKNMASYADVSIGFANWGVRDATLAKKGQNWATQAHALGKQWMEPVAVQDERPRDGLYQEAWNTETLRATWNRAISHEADAVLLTTWNDYSECTSFAPSTDHGTAFLDISAYFLAKFKTGAYRTPAKDAVFIVHRIQKHSTLPTTYANVMKPWYSTGSASRDKIEVVTLLRSQSEVSVEISGQTATYTAPAGFNAQLFDLATGEFTATVGSSGPSVRTKDPVSFTTKQQDLSYHAVSSND